MRWFKLFLLLIFIPGVALAADQETALTFTPPETDLSVIFLGNIFGLVEGVLYGTGSQIMGAIFSVFNHAVLALGGIILMYTLMVSTLRTAHEGEMLGRKWDSIWVPIRSTVAVALLLPMKSGYCTMQIFVMWVIMQGIGAADAMWNASLDYLKQGGFVVAKSQSQPGQEQGSALQSLDPKYVKEMEDRLDYASNLLQNLICMHGLQEVLERARDNWIARGNDDPGAVPNFISYIDTVAQQRRGKLEIQFPPSDPTIRAPYNSLAGICGKITWNALTTDELNTLRQNLGSAGGVSTGAALGQSVFRTTPFLSTISQPGQLGVGSLGADDPAIQDAQISRPLAIQQMILDLSGTAQNVVRNYFSSQGNPDTALELGHLNPNEPNTPEAIWTTSNNRPALLTGFEIKNSLNVYAAVMGPTMRAMSNFIEGLDFVDKAKKDGWIMAGSYFFQMARVNQADRDFQMDLDAFHVSTPEDPAGTEALGAEASGGLPPKTMGGTDFYLKDDYKDNLRALTSIPKIPDDGTMTTNTYPQQIAYYLSSAQNIYMRGDAGLGFKPVLFQFNLAPIPKLPAPDCWGTFCIPGGVEKLSVFFANLVIDGVNSVLISAVGALLTPLFLVSNAFYAALGAAFTTGNNPILALAGLGSIFINAAATFFVGGIAFATSTGLMPGTTAGTNVIIFMMPVIFVLMIGMFTFGASLAYYIPFIPYIIFTLAALSWFIAVIEAMVAAPIVALGLSHPESQNEAFGRAEPAIMLLLNVFLRPAMMIIGFIAGIILSYIGIWMLNEGFARASMGIMGGGISAEGVSSSTGGATGLAAAIGPLFIIAIYIILVIQIVQKSFDLIHIVPDKVLRWIQGGNAEALGAQTAGGGTEAVRGAVVGGAQAIGRATPEMISGAGKAAQAQQQAEMGESQGQMTAEGDDSAGSLGQGDTSVVGEGRGGGGGGASGGGAAVGGGRAAGGGGADVGGGGLSEEERRRRRRRGGAAPPPPPAEAPPEEEGE